MKKTVSFLVAALCLVGTYSCQKEDVQPTRTPTVVITPLGIKEGGDDDEDPIIQGYVMEDEVLADSVVTRIIPSGTETPIFSTEDNGFEAQVPKGAYFFQVITNVGDTVTTGNYSIVEDVEVTIYLD